MLPDDLDTRIGVYCAATGSTRCQAVHQLLALALTTWETETQYMPERLCGRVRQTVQ